MKSPASWYCLLIERVHPGSTILGLSIPRNERAKASITM